MHVFLPLLAARQAGGPGSTGKPASLSELYSAAQKFAGQLEQAQRQLSSSVQLPVPQASQADTNACSLQVSMLTAGTGALKTAPCHAIRSKVSLLGCLAYAGKSMLQGVDLSDPIAAAKNDESLAVCEQVEEQWARIMSDTLHQEAQRVPQGGPAEAWKWGPLSVSLPLNLAQL